MSSVEQVRSVVAKSQKSVALLIQRGEDKIFVPVCLGKFFARARGAVLV